MLWLSRAGAEDVLYPLGECAGRRGEITPRYRGSDSDITWVWELMSNTYIWPLIVLGFFSSIKTILPASTHQHASIYRWHSDVSDLRGSGVIPSQTENLSLSSVLHLILNLFCHIHNDAPLSNFYLGMGIGRWGVAGLHGAAPLGRSILHSTHLRVSQHASVCIRSLCGSGSINRRVKQAQMCLDWNRPKWEKREPHNLIGSHRLAPPVSQHLSSRGGTTAQLSDFYFVAVWLAFSILFQRFW